MSPLHACAFTGWLSLKHPFPPSTPTPPHPTPPPALGVRPCCQVNASCGKGGGGPPGGGGDSSAAWRTTSGTWRLLTRDALLSTVWESADFRSWARVGPQPGFTQGACPSFFPLPNTTHGAGPAPPGAKEPTHVYLYGDTTLPGAGSSHRTVLVPGVYTEHGVGRPVNRAVQ